MKEKIILRIEELPIAQRSINCLKAAGFITEADFETVSERDLLKIEGFGPVGLSELKLFLKGRGIKFFRDKKEKKVYHPKSRDLVRQLLQQKPTPKEIKLADRLLEKYTFEELTRISVKANVTSLTYFMAGVGSWLDELINKNAPQKVDTSEIEFFKQTELREILPEPEKIRRVGSAPMTLKEFLKI